MAGKTKEHLRQEHELAWEQLQQHLPPELLSAPRLDWSTVYPRFFRYLYHDVHPSPWFCHLVFMVGILTSHTKLSQRTIEAKLYNLHARWREIFTNYDITAFERWDPAEHLVRYMRDEQCSDSLETRQKFLQMYCSASRQMAAYIRSLPEPARQVYVQWALPALPADIYRKISLSNLSREQQQQRRKEETDAVVPQFGQIRGQAHLRWNQLKRLRDKVREVERLIQTGSEKLPLPFCYDEPNLGQRLHFCLWDRYHFAKEHIDQYRNKRAIRNNLKLKRGGYAPEKNHLFLEFLYAEDLSTGARNPDGLLWFGELLRYDVLGTKPRLGETPLVKAKSDYLRSWGYLDEERPDETPQPFRTFLPGLLAWPKAHEAFLTKAQKMCKGLLFLIEPLFAAATFGLAALDFFTTTGARNGELLQLSLDRDCLFTVTVEGMSRYLARVIPKGTEKLADYVVGTETLRNFEKVGDLLQEHYHLQPGENIPYLIFDESNNRAHLFKEPRPYLFQYNHQHFREASVNACMRFLCHGMIFETTDGKMVKLKAHLLRHAFATHIHQVEAVPLDVIAVMLHQKNVQVTAYYAAPPWQQVLATANTLLDKFATHLGSIEEAFVRAPAELQRQLEEAKATVGSLNKIVGGDCTCHALCPISFACTGCVYNIPDPDREDEIIEQEQWAFIRLEQVTRRGQGPERVKMQALIQRCRVTRQEMQMIRAYRKDESYEPVLTLGRKEQRATTSEAVASQALRGETPADGQPRQGRSRSTRQSTTNSHD